MEPEPEVEPVFVELDRQIVPVIDQAGRLVSYASFDIRLAVAPADEPFVKLQMPAVQHGINAALSTSPVADANERRVIDYALAEAAILAGANAKLERPAVRGVHISAVALMD